MLFLLSAVLFIFTLWAVFFFGLSRSAGALVLIAASIAMPLISPWSLIFGIPLILLSLIVLIGPLRMNMITKPAYKTLANAMPSMSSTEREALDAGCWHQLVGKRIIYGRARLEKA
jgi:acyl-CoA dehydrogenase